MGGDVLKDAFVLERRDNLLAGTPCHVVKA
jgi:hypothetical protein